MIAAPVDAVYMALTAPGANLGSAFEGGTVSGDGRTTVTVAFGRAAGIKRGAITFRLSPVAEGTLVRVETVVEPTMKYRLIFWLASKLSTGDDTGSMFGLLDEIGPDLEAAAQTIASGARPASG